MSTFAPTREPALGPEAIRPFHVTVPQEAIDDLRRRLAATRWPDQETVADASQGAQLAKMQELVGYWATDYDWRKVEARLNALPMFVTTIDDVEIQFMHVRSKHENALPVIVTHGWPGSILELLDVIEPLTDPTTHHGNPEDAFHVVIPSLPGYGFSGRPTVSGWNPARTARAWDVLMQRLGYRRYVAQGGDVGALVSQDLARQAPDGLLGIHLNLPATVPPEVDAALNAGGPAPADMSEQERATYDALVKYRMSGFTGYLVAMSARPQAVGYGMTDSPAGLLAFILQHPGFATWDFGNDPDDPKSKDEVLDDISLYWLTNTATSAARSYWENHGRSVISATAMQTTDIAIPVGITVFPEDVYRPPESWARRAYPNLTYFHEVDKGGHFAAWEQPGLFSAELREAFRPLR